MKNKVNRTPYFVCTGLSGLQMGIMFTWTYYRDFLASMFPSWSASRLSLIFSMHNITVVVLALVSGVLLRYLKPRTLVAMAAVMSLIGLGAFPFLPLNNSGAAYVMLFICFGIVAAASPGFGGIAIPAAYQPWVPDHLGLLTGILFLASGCSPILFGYICSLLIPIVGVLRTVQIIGVIAFLLLIVTLRWCKAPGPDVELPYPKTVENAASKYNYSWKEILRSPLFWLFFLYCCMARSIGVILQDLGGMIAITFGVAALLGLVTAPANGAASVIGGVIQDRIGLNKTIFLACGIFVFCSLLFILGNISGSAFLGVTALVFGGAGLGVTQVVCASGTRILFGDKYYAQNYSFMTMSLAPAAAGGYIAGLLLDRFGNYNGVFILVLSLSALSLVFGLMLVRSRRETQ